MSEKDFQQTPFTPEEGQQQELQPTEDQQHHEADDQKEQLPTEYIDEREAKRQARKEKFARMKPALKKFGIITAGVLAVGAIAAMLLPAPEEESDNVVDADFEVIDED